MHRMVGRTGGLAGIALALALGACREPSRPAPAATQLEAAAAAPPAPSVFQPPPQPKLGVEGLPELAWAERAGHAAFRRARTAERRGDWAQMVQACQEALAADGSHLEASWLLAAGLSHLRRFDEVGAPLARAVAGDPAKWAQPALQLPLFAPYWASGAGAALQPWIAEQQAQLQAMLARAVVLLHRDRLLAYDRQSRRFLPLARPHRLRGALVVRPLVAFVTGGVASDASKERLGVVDLRTGVTSLAPLASAHRRELAVVAGDGEPAVLVRDDGGPWQRAADKELVLHGGVVPRELAPRMVLEKGRATLVRHPAPGVLADWDQGQMASALRIRRSNRLVTVPAPMLIDGQRVVWTPSKSHLALVAGLDSCERRPAGAGGAPAGLGALARVYVVDAITGVPRQVMEAKHSLDAEWVGDRVLAISSDVGVTLVDPDLGGGDEPVELPAVSLPGPVRRSRCVDPEPDSDALPVVEDLDDL